MLESAAQIVRRRTDLRYMSRLRGHVQIETTPRPNSSISRAAARQAQSRGTGGGGRIVTVEAITWRTSLDTLDLWHDTRKVFREGLVVFDIFPDETGGGIRRGSRSNVTPC